jgi:hypothetical protein
LELLSPEEVWLIVVAVRTGQGTGKLMEHISTAIRFSAWAFEMLLLPPCGVVFILSAISLIWAAIKQRPFKMRLWRPYHWMVLTQALFFVAAIAVGVLGANPIANPTLPHPPVPAAPYALGTVSCASIALAGFWIWQMKGFRWFAASLLILFQVITLGAIVVAEMSVYGEWM